MTVGLNGNYPYGYGGYGYGGYGYGYGYGWPSSVIIINHDAMATITAVVATVAATLERWWWRNAPATGRRFSSVSGYGGTTPPPGVINTMGGAISGSSHR